MRGFLLLILGFLPSVALATDLSFGYTPTLEGTDRPAFMVTPTRPILTLQVVIEAGGRSYRYERTNLPVGKEVRFEWDRNPSVTAATVSLLVEYQDHYEEEMRIPLQYAYATALTVDLYGAAADVAARTLSVRVTAAVDRADIIAYGAHKAILDQRTVTIGAGPGEIAVPWIGSPSEVVLLDVTLHSGNAWSGFTYSPWFLDIPHDDVLFETDKAVIQSEEEYKLLATLTELGDVLDKYGEIVPVKLYIAGCTDTVGDAEHNRELSAARARAIAAWLRAHGYAKPIFTYGFGESWLAEPTADNIDSPLNRRAVYMVGANPPPAGSGVPSASWK